MTEMSSTLLLLLRTSSGGPYFKSIYISNLNCYVSKSTGILDKIVGIHDVSSVNPECLKLFNPVQIIFLHNLGGSSESLPIYEGIRVVLQTLQIVSFPPSTSDLDQLTGDDPAVTLVSHGWRSLNHPKKVTSRIAKDMDSILFGPCTES